METATGTSTIEELAADARVPLEDLVRRPEMVGNPHPVLRRIRQTPGVWACPSGSPIFTRYRPSREILRSPELFGQIASPQVEPSLVQLDPPEHNRIRSLISRVFTPKAIGRLTDEIDEIAGRVFEPLRGRDEIDIVEDLAQPIATHTISAMVGLPFAAIDEWTPHARTLAAAYGPITYTEEQQQRALPLLQAGFEASLAEAEFYRSVIADRRREVPRDDLLGLLITAEESGNRLTESEIWWNLVQIVSAANHTTVGLITTGTMRLLENPKQWAALRADSALLPHAIEEMLRFDPPIFELVRLVRAENVIDGAELRAGQTVRVVVGAANRDPAQFAEPDLFDIARPNAREHLGFGSGVHHCIGASLARAEALAAFRHILRLDGLERASSEPVRWSPGMYTMQRPQELRLRWSRVQPRR